MAFLHGVETIELEIGGQPTNVSRTAVIALPGIAPAGPVNQLTLCLSSSDDAQFGKQLPGFNIPRTLAIIRAIAGNCPVLVVNTFDSVANVTAVVKEPQTVTAGKLKLAFAPLGTITIYLNDGTTLASIVKGTDYTLDEFGNFKVISGNIANGTTYKFSYNKLNGASVTTTQIIGGNDDGDRTGISLYDLAYNMFGFKPKIFISPIYSSLAAIAAAFATAAAKFRAVYCLDAPYGTTVSGAIAGRGVGSALVFNTGDARAILLYPYIKSFDAATGTDTDFPYSAFYAALMAKIDNDSSKGFWYAADNQQILAATGVERTIEWSINDKNTEANQLNNSGIVTIAQGYGTGILAWGLRNASFPASSSVKNFITIRRADDVVIETMEEAARPFIGKPINQAQIDAIRESGNATLRTLIGLGAVLPGSEVIYNKDDNSAENLANGQITFARRYMIPPSTEHIILKDVLDISLLNQFN